MRRGCFAMLAACCAIAVPLTGCGSGGTSSASTAVTESTPPATTRRLSAAERERLAARRDHRERIRLERTFAPNPYPEPSDSRPHPHGRITHLEVRDIKLGHGPAIRGNEHVYINYVMTFWKSGKKFNEAWGPLRAEYRLLGDDPSGIPRGMVGMRPGGRRVILLPARISQAHEPNGGGSYVDARVDLVLRKIAPPE